MRQRRHGVVSRAQCAPQSLLGDWLDEVEAGLAEHRRAHPDGIVAPYAVNQIIHQSNDRLEHDLDVCARHRVPYIITSLRAPGDLVAGVHAWGGKVFHDVTTVRHAEKALEAGVDGLIWCAPARAATPARSARSRWSPKYGASTMGRWYCPAQSPRARASWRRSPRGRLRLYGYALHRDRRGQCLRGLQAGHRRRERVRRAVHAFFTGIPGNYLKASIVAAGLDPADLPAAEAASSNFGTTRAKPWKDIWGAGQGVGGIASVLPARELVASLRAEYAQAQARLGARNLG